MTTSHTAKRRWAVCAIIVAALCAAVVPLRAEDPAAPPAPPAEPEEPIYHYSSTSRDPFIPLTGAGLSEFSGVEKEPGAFNPASVELKGILKTKTGRWAVLRGSGRADMYIVENGKIRDSKRKAVDGFVGIVKEKSLVLIDRNNQVTELKLKKDQEQAERTP